ITVIALALAEIASDTHGLCVGRVWPNPRAVAVLVLNPPVPAVTTTAFRGNVRQHPRHLPARLQLACDLCPAAWSCGIEVGEMAFHHDFGLVKYLSLLEEALRDPLAVGLQPGRRPVRHGRSPHDPEVARAAAGVGRVLGEELARWPLPLLVPT